MDEEKKDRVTDKLADLEEVKRVWGPMEAELAKTFLESQGIQCLVRGRTVGFIYPLTVDGMAEFKVFVNRADAPKAIELLRNMPSDGSSGGDPDSRD